MAHNVTLVASRILLACKILVLCIHSPVTIFLFCWKRDLNLYLLRPFRHWIKDILKGRWQIPHQDALYIVFSILLHWSMWWRCIKIVQRNKSNYCCKFLRRGLAVIIIDRTTSQMLHYMSKCALIPSSFHSFFLFYFFLMIFFRSFLLEKEVNSEGANCKHFKMTLSDTRVDTLLNMFRSARSFTSCSWTFLEFSPWPRHQLSALFHEETLFAFGYLLIHHSF